jgi:hypothetical protein
MKAEKETQCSLEIAMTMATWNFAGKEKSSQGAQSGVGGGTPQGTSGRCYNQLPHLNTDV